MSLRANMAAYRPNCIGQVTGNIYLTDEFYDPYYLRQLGITKILSVGSRRQLPLGFKTKYLHVGDVATEPIDRVFDEAFAFIGGPDGGEKVLVHCQMGISRSPTIVIAWLMRMKGMGLDEAMGRVRYVRNFIRPNDGFMAILKKYEHQAYL